MEIKKNDGTMAVNCMFCHIEQVWIVAVPGVSVQIHNERFYGTVMLVKHSEMQSLVSRVVEKPICSG
jgi:hypothetical protein